MRLLWTGLNLFSYNLVQFDRICVPVVMIHAKVCCSDRWRGGWKWLGVVKGGKKRKCNKTMCKSESARVNKRFPFTFRRVTWPENNWAIRLPGPGLEKNCDPGNSFFLSIFHRDPVVSIENPARWNRSVFIFTVDKKIIVKKILFDEKKHRRIEKMKVDWNGIPVKLFSKLLHSGKKTGMTHT